ncbi:diaminopimelate decarboxylase [Candidatus Kaiserbacteria bacterium]|nr:diaminopimelate decarboxylase [Candidatus Kaiserbacteria bacterium]
MQKSVPFTKAQMEELNKKYPTPFYIYDEAGIRASARTLIDAFSWLNQFRPGEIDRPNTRESRVAGNPGFKEYFAVKATPNPRILSMLKEERCGSDCSSLPELILSERVGIVGEDIMFTSNDTPAEEFVKAKALGAIINLDAFEHIEYLEKSAGLPEMLSFRYNPGSAREGNVIIGKPEEAKFGMTHKQLMDAYRLAKRKGVKRFGLHTMIASNELHLKYFVETARMLFDLVREIKSKLDITIEIVNLGGGIGIPYRPEQEPIDVDALSREVRKLYDEYNLAPLRLAMECGRFVTGPHGYLVSKVRHIKDTYRAYAGLDATMANLMRPALYGAYHHITVLGKENAKQTKTYDVVGSLCENNDKFAIMRDLPKLAPDDIVVIHDVGAHGHAMGFNYNGKLRSAEFLMHPDNSFTMIRRAETMDDYFVTLA